MDGVLKNSEPLLWPVTLSFKFSSLKVISTKILYLFITTFYNNADSTKRHPDSA
jgi:hypothetical protein